MENTMKKHGLSHGAAVLVCSVTSALMVDIIQRHVPFVHRAVEKIVDFVLEKFPLPILPDYLGILIYSTALAVLWGMCFAMMHED